MIDARTVAALVRPHLTGSVELELIQEGDDHAVFDAGDAIVKCGRRDDPRAEAWACEHARANGVPASRVIAMSVEEPIPYLVLARAEGVPLWDPRLSDELAIVAAREAGALLRRLHEHVVPGFGWMAGDDMGGVRGKSSTWREDVTTELEWSLGYLDERQLVDAAVVARVRAGLERARPLLDALDAGRLLHGDVGRMHVFADPGDGHVTEFIDWGDVTAGDPVWELAVANCHMSSESEGHLGYRGHRGLFPHLLDGYAPDQEIANRIEALMPLYFAYRYAWVARMCHEGLAFVPDHLADGLVAMATELDR